MQLLARAEALNQKMKIINVLLTPTHPSLVVGKLTFYPVITYALCIMHYL